MTSSTAAVKTSENKFLRFFTGIWSELKKVVWLSRREVTYLTILVLIVAIITGAFLWAIDLGFTTLIENFVIK